MVRVVRKFSLLELATGLAVVMVLAALSLPAVHEHALRSKFVEIDLNLEGIATAAIAYEASFGSYGTPATYNPDVMPAWGSELNPWNPAIPGWVDLGWAPDGDLRGHYLYDGTLTWDYSPALGWYSRDEFTQVWVQTDLDRDGIGYRQRAYVYEGSVVLKKAAFCLDVQTWTGVPLPGPCY